MDVAFNFVVTRVPDAYTADVLTRTLEETLENLGYYTVLYPEILE